MRNTLKFLAILTLTIPALLLTFLIWLFGGWTKGWYYMPNPANALIRWAVDI